MQGYRAAKALCLTACTLGGAGAAWAQAGSNSSEQAGPETVTVTAERRAEDIQKTPITVTAVKQKQLDIQNITTTSDLVRAVPSLTTSDEGVYQIRSIGTQGFGRSAEQSVSVVLDGVVLGRALTNAMYDLDNVEVLSGPQGTLFGKNATGGVINIVTNAPVLDEYQAIGHADVGDHDYVHSYLVGNIPLGDDAALRVSFHHDNTGHIVYNTLYHEWDSNADDGVRARLLWEPTGDLTINLEGDYQKLSSNGVNGVADFAGVQVYTSAPADSELAATLAACGIKPGPNNNRVCANSLKAAGVNLGDTYGRINEGASLTVDYKLPMDLTFTSITALRETTNEDFGVHADIAGEFGDTLPQNVLDRNLVPYHDRSWSEEARITSPADDPVNFVAGIYWSNTDTHDEIDQSGQFGIPLGSLEYRRLINMYITQENYAAFGQVNWHITPDLQVFAGGRVTHDSLSDYSFNSFPDAYPNGPFLYTGATGFFSVIPVNSCTLAGGLPYDTVQIPCPAGTNITSPGKLSKTGLSGKLGVQYQLTDDTMIFGTVARGYKGPFINESVSYTAGLAKQPLAVASEYPTDFELGVKTTLFDRLQVDASLFTDKIDGFQTTIYVPPVPPLTVANFIQGNAPHAITRGLEVNFFGNITDNLNLSGGFIYNDAHFNQGFLVSCATGPCPAIDQLPFAPRWKATVAGEYHQEVGGGFEGFLQSDLAYSSRYFYGSAPGSFASPDRYLVGARLGMRTDDGHWSLALFCRNCLDKRYPIDVQPDGYQFLDGAFVPVPPATKVGPPAPSYQFLTIDSYRVVGLTLDVQY